LNGSPKANNSITLQHIKYFQNQEKNHEIGIIDISKKIKKVEKEPDLFNEIIKKIEMSDAVIWSFPVYYALVPSQMKRFIELMFERCGKNYFDRKYATSFTTSIRFFDHTAHNYMRGVCEELGFSYIKGYSAHMRDFFKKDQRLSMYKFFKWFIRMVEKGVPVQRKYKVIPPPAIVYDPGDLPMTEKTLSQKVLLLTDAGEEDINLNRMIQTFEKTSSMPVKVKNIRAIDMKNGCLGCCTCGYDNTCIQKDGYREFFNTNLKKADIIILSGTIKDHYLSSIWKKFLDRSFFNGHVPVLRGKRVGFMLSGPLSQIQNLRECLEALADNWHMKTFGIVTDEHDTSEAITAHIRAFAEELELVSHNNVEFSPTFYRAGGQKIFRDFIFNSRGVFRADHLYYKEHGFYNDFPQREVKNRLKDRIFSFFVSIKPLRKEIHKKFIPGMVEPYKKVLSRI
jgi:multimeric flavodoxin WrbA